MASGSDVTIAPACTPEDIAAVSGLFRAYAASLDVDLCFQGFAEELAGLPGRYAPPAGALFLARDGARAALGCVGLRPVDPATCEMKRLYVAPQARGAGLGRDLVTGIIRAAERIGYREMRLDSLPSMRAAVALYGSCGFEPMAPYYDSPVAGTQFMRRMLRPG